MKRYIEYLALAAILVAICSCSKEPEDIPYEPQTPVGKVLLDNCPEVARVFSDTTFLVAVGVEETDLHIQTMEGYVQQLYLIRVDTNVPGVRMSVALPNNIIPVGGGWNLQTLTDMASKMNVPRSRVAAMVNGDYWQNENLPVNPRGPVHKSGSIVSSEWDYDPNMPQQALSFVGVLDDGTMIIAPRAEYDTVKDRLRECTGAGFIMLSNGEFPGTEWNARDPRTAIGYSDDGIVWLLTCDGRRTFGADGMTYKEIGYIFQSLGCVGAAALDGGGSAQMLIRNPVASVWQIRNSPSDGKERPVINGWAVVVDEP